MTLRLVPGTYQYSYSAAPLRSRPYCKVKGHLGPLLVDMRKEAFLCMWLQLVCQSGGIGANGEQAYSC